MSNNEAQRTQWNGEESEHWVRHADRYDAQLAPFSVALFERLDLSADDAVLDVGCGCGATTIETAHRGARALGVDLSQPMLEVARARAVEAGVANVEFSVADAQSDSLGAGAFNRAVSRFGVMFFDDPIAAFANLRRALVPGGRLDFVCWQPLVANEWLLVPGSAAAGYVPFPEPGDGDQPGMFAFGDERRVREVLESAGFERVEIEPFITTISLGGGGDVEATLDFLLGTGLARSLFADAPADAVAEAIEAVREALAEHYVPGLGVRLGAAAWLVAAA